MNPLMDNRLPESLRNELVRLVDERRLRSIDVQMAGQLLQWSEQTFVDEQATTLFVLTCALSWALGRGQVCLPLDHCLVPELGRWWPQEGVLETLTRDVVWHQPTDIPHEPLSSSGWNGQPLVLEIRQGKPVRLYLARYFFYQQGVEAAIRTRTQVVPANPADTELGASLRALFPHHPGQAGPDWQAVAAATACLQHFCVITGGPGTGKTTTVTRMLCALLGQHPEMTIALAAPTGKAAARMLESIRQSRQRDNLPGAERIPDESFTLHRLLGWTPDGFRYGPERPLPWDCVVVDEASMIDLAMMYQLLSALAPHARLVLLGDKDQLASVEAGSVLADVSNPDGGFGLSAGFAGRLQSLLGYDMEPSIGPWRGPLQDAVARLYYSRRFSEESGIGQLAKAVNAGDVAATIRCFNSFATTDLYLDSTYQLPAGSPRRALLPWQQRVINGYHGYCEALAKGDVTSILSAFAEFRVLVAVRQGNQGVETVNRQIEELLAAHAGLQRKAGSPWYIGRPVMVTRNDYDLGLFNGDIGIMVHNHDHEPRVAFEDTDGSIRYYLPGRLPSHETAFAMTVHKSQGSEFDRVLLLLPERWQTLISRELVYTAITRARRHFALVSGPECWQRGVQNRVERASGLAAVLWT